MSGSVVAVSCSATYTFSKPNREFIILLAGWASKATLIWALR